MYRALIIEPLSNFDPVKGVYPIEMSGNRAGFISLDLADKMPLNTHATTLYYFGLCILQIVFPEMPLASLVGSHYFRPWLGLADCNQRNMP